MALETTLTKQLDLMLKQKQKFRDAEEIVEFLPPEERDIFVCLRELIFKCIPEIREKISYNVPFYFMKKRILFIWPSSIPWSRVKKGVTIGFCYGNLLVDEDNYLEKEDRKQVYMKTFQKKSEINIPVLKKLIFEAVVVDGGGI